MDRLSITLTTAGVAVAIAAGAIVHATAQQIIMTTQDTRVAGGGPLGGGAPDRPLSAGTGLIVGQAIDASTKRPVADALVTLQSSGYLPAQVLADTEGRFVFRDLPAGRFNLTATRPGYADGAFGRVRPTGPSQSIDLAADQKLADVTMPMWKFAVVSGTVLDENGDPLVGAPVRILRQAIVAGKRQLQQAGQETTDDRGTYRLSALTPGDYVVVLPMTPNSDSLLDGLLGKIGDRVNASFNVAGRGGGGAGGNVAVGGVGSLFNVQMAADLSGGADASTAGLTDDGHILSYPTTFYPTAGSPARATLITLASGDERLGVDFQLRPVRTAKVSGVIAGPDGPAQNLSVTLTPADYDDLVTPIGAPQTTTDGTGRFTFIRVPPGSYVLRAIKSPGAGEISITRGPNGATMMVRAMVISNDGAPPPLPTDATLWTEASVPVAANDVTGLSLSLRPAIRVNGTIAFNGGTAKPTADQLQAISVTLEAADGRTAVAGGSARGRVDPNGTFQTMGVPPGKYILRVSGAPQGFSFFGAMMGTRDVSIDPIEIAGSDVGGIALTFTDRPTDLGGMVTQSGGTPDSGASVIVFPTDPDQWAGHGASPRRIRTARVAKDGSFDIPNLPPGQYLAAAVPDGISPDPNPKFLELLTRTATRIEIGPGEQKKQTLQTANPGVR